jgi:hypothetical protein
LTGTIRLLADQIVPCQLLVHAKQLNRPERNATAFLLIQSNSTATSIAKTLDEIGTAVKPQQFYILKALIIGEILFLFKMSSMGF